MGPKFHPKLIVEEGPTQGEEIELTRQELIIGRDLSADLVIPSPAVSRRHARIYYQESLPCKDIPLYRRRRIQPKRIGGCKGTPRTTG